MKIREEMITRLEEADRLMRDNGSCEKWFYGSGDSLLPVVRGANGRLFQSLLEATGYGDADAAYLLRDGLSCLFALLVSCSSSLLSSFRCSVDGAARVQWDRPSR